MQKLTPADLYKLEDYAVARADFRRTVMDHKRNRSIALGPNITLLFEDALTVQYQIQEMLRIERIFEPVAIQDELDAYNPLIPDDDNLKATMLIEYPDRDERVRKLMELHGIENLIHLNIAGHGSAATFADEDLTRATEEKTSAVHFLRFDLDPAQVQAIRDGANLAIAVDHPAYHARTVLPENVRQALAADLA